MADNIDVTPGTGKTIAADDISGALHQRVKLTWGVDGTANDASASNPLPISDAGGSLTVDGAVSITGSVAVTGTFWQATQPVSGTFWQATQPISASALPLPSGASTSALQTSGNTLTGAVTETAPASDTASSGLNGRLQRIAQRITSLITALGNPFQAGGSIGNSAFGATQSGTWNLTNISGTVSLPTGAATSAKQDTGNGSLASIAAALAGTEYETVAASQSDQALGATGATGDLLESLLIVPATTAPGAVSIKDGAGSAITVFTGGTDSVSNLVPFIVPLGIKSGAGAWKVTTGANVSVIASGDFT